MVGQTNNVIHFSVVTSSIIVRALAKRGDSLTSTKRKLIHTSRSVSCSSRRTTYVETPDEWHIHFSIYMGRKRLGFYPEIFLFTRRKVECLFLWQILSCIWHILICSGRKHFDFPSHFDAHYIYLYITYIISSRISGIYQMKTKCLVSVSWPLNWLHEVRPERPAVVQLLMNSVTIYGNRNFIIVFRTDLHWPLS
jgi:hypothetical protein